MGGATISTGAGFLPSTWLTGMMVYVCTVNINTYLDIYIHIYIYITHTGGPVSAYQS